jgi:predicted nucleotidyltransferase
MSELKPRQEAAQRFQPFLDELVTRSGEKLHSVYLVGSALTADFDPKISDVNSVVVLHRMDLKFLQILAPLGKKYGKRGIAAPLIMTPGYVLDSLDVFPIEFLNIKLFHATVMGEDIFQNLSMAPADLRQQCERELKVKLISLRQGYLSSSGSGKFLRRGFVSSFSGYIPLFRAILVLLEVEVSAEFAEVLMRLEESTAIRTAVFRKVHEIRKRRTRPSAEELNVMFEQYYGAIEQLGELVNGLEI